MNFIDLSNYFIEFLLLNVIMFLLLMGVFLNASVSKDKHPTVFKVIGVFSIITLFVVLFLLFYWKGSVLKICVVLITLFCLLNSLNYLIQIGVDQFEYFILILLTVFGMLVLISADDFLLFFLSLEIVSFCSYILACFKKDNTFSMESGFKYFIIGSFASAVMLFGISLIVGITGLFNFSDLDHIIGIRVMNVPIPAGQFTIMFGVFLVLTAFLFKLALAPFHLWAPDVYEGTILPVGMFLSTAPKVAVYTAFIKVLMLPFDALLYFWHFTFICIGTCSVVIGTFNALRQVKLKRFLAYASISHMGYILIASSFGNLYGVREAFVYLLIYVILSLSLWGSLIALNSMYDNNFKYITDLSILKKTNPLFGLILIINIFSMCGVPPLAGFFAKYAVLSILVKKGYMNLAFFLIFLNVVASFYYLRIIKKIFFETSVKLKVYKEKGRVSLFLIMCLLSVNIFYIFLSPFVTTIVEGLNILFRY